MNTKEYIKKRILEQSMGDNPQGVNSHRAMVNASIERRATSSRTSGIDSGTGEQVLRGSPLDQQGQSTLQYANNLRTHVDTATDKIRDPLNLKNIAASAKKQGAGPVRTAVEMDKRDVQRM